MLKAANPVRFVTEAGGGPGVFAGPPDMPPNLDDIPAWYEQEYKNKIWKPKMDMVRLNESALNPGRTWRLGLAAEVFGPSPRF